MEDYDDRDFEDLQEEVRLLKEEIKKIKASLIPSAGIMRTTTTEINSANDPHYKVDLSKIRPFRKEVRDHSNNQT